jgi:hypothetical protein
MRQITETIDYTEVMTDGTTYIVQRHDRTVSTHTSEAEAIAAFRKLVSRPGRGDYR